MWMEDRIGMDKNRVGYKPLQFVAITFVVTWICAFFMAYQTWVSPNTTWGSVVIILADFLESASPLLAALILWRKPLFSERRIFRFVLGNRSRLAPYLIVIFLFVYQFLTFYLFGTADSAISITAFLSAWFGQVLLGGGMEEGGWRGYLQPAIEQKVHITITVVLVGLVWAIWHLPYFFLPNTFLSGSSFPLYIMTTIATAFTLTAIYKLTGSVLLCTLFHGWQNAIVMAIPPNMQHPGFLIMWALQTVISVILCIKPLGAEKRVFMA
jgi:membrane protease YdiL (CAAX protease family)